jgi:hypothetical protein
VNYDPTCTYDRGDVFIGNASLSVMCGIFALLHKLRLALVSDNLFLRCVMSVVYCEFVSSGRCVAYHDAVRDTTRRHNLRFTRLLLALLYGKISLKWVSREVTCLLRSNEEIFHSSHPIVGKMQMGNAIPF